MSKVDVLAVMDRISGRMFDTPDLRAIADCGELRRVRAIIAELIGAAQSLRTIYAIHADRSSPAHTVLAPSIDRLNSAIEQVKPCGGDAVAWIIPASLERLAECYSATVYGKLAIEVHKPTADVATIPLFTHPDGAVQVTDEMVERALDEYVTPSETLPHRAILRDRMRAALTAALNPGGSRE